MYINKKETSNMNIEYANIALLFALRTTSFWLAEMVRCNDL